MTEPNQEAVEQIVTKSARQVLHDQVYREARGRHLNDATQSGYDHHSVVVAAEHGARLAIQAFANHRRTASAQSTSGDVERVAEEWSHYMDQAVSKAPEPLRQLGEYLAGVLNEDEWPTAERHLNAAAIAAMTDPQTPSEDDFAYHEDWAEAVRRGKCAMSTISVPSEEQRPSPGVDVDLVERVAEAIARCDPGNNPAQARLYARAAIASMPDERKLIVGWLQGEAVRHLRASEIADAIERGQHISATVEG